MLKTHSNFKSLNPFMKNAKDINDYLLDTFSHQYLFEKRTLPEEKELWEAEELNSFKINPEKIDRLYYIYRTHNGPHIWYFNILLRLDYKGRQLYVELKSNYCVDYDYELHHLVIDYYEPSNCFIFVSYNPILFMKLILSLEHNKDLIYQSLSEDGIDINEIIDIKKIQKAHDIYDNEHLNLIKGIQML